MPSKAIRIPEELYQQLNRLAAETNMSISDVVTQKLEGMPPSKEYREDARRLANYPMGGGILSDFIAALKMMQEMNSPPALVSNVANTAQSLAVLQKMFEQKPDIKTGLLKSLMEIPEVKTVVGQVILTLFQNMMPKAQNLGAASQTPVQQTPWVPPGVTIPASRPASQGTLGGPATKTPEISTPTAEEVAGVSFNDLDEFLEDIPEAQETKEVADEELDTFDEDQQQETSKSPPSLIPNSLEISPSQIGEELKRILLTGTDEELRDILIPIVGNNEGTLSMILGLIKNVKSGNTGAVTGLLGNLK